MKPHFAETCNKDVKSNHKNARRDDNKGENGIRDHLSVENLSFNSVIFMVILFFVFLNKKKVNIEIENLFYYYITMKQESSLKCLNYFYDLSQTRLISMNILTKL